MCSCSQYQDLEFVRKVITERIKDSRELKKSFELVAKHPDKEHKLYRCGTCDQLWQSSRAWNWGNDEYLFKVPRIRTEDWLLEVYVQPDEMFIFTAVISKFLKENTFIENNALCTIDSCEKNSVSGSVNCLRHHLESLQRIHTMPAYPSGRWFKPYNRENIIPAF